MDKVGASSHRGGQYSIDLKKWNALVTKLEVQNDESGKCPDRHSFRLKDSMKSLDFSEKVTQSNHCPIRTY
jgi:hypothetical protein